MPKYCVKNYFAHGRFPEAKDGGKRGERERLNDGNNNGQATHGARKPPGPKNNKKIRKPPDFQDFFCFLWPTFSHGRLYFLSSSMFIAFHPGS